MAKCWSDADFGTLEPFIATTWPSLMNPLERSSLRTTASRTGSGEALPQTSFTSGFVRELRVGVPLAILIGIILSLIMRAPFFRILTYSMCISLTIQGLIAAGRYGMSHQLRRYFPNHPSAFHNWPGWALMAPWVMVSAALGYTFGHWLGDLLTGVAATDDVLHHAGGALVATMAVVLLISMACTYFFYARGRLAAMQIQAQSALRAAAENQLKLLASQLEPHMLFNTLANLRVLIRLDPPRAEAMLDRLIAFLRAMLEASQAGSHCLAAEFARIDDYLALMQVRMGPRLRSRLDLPPELAELAVPPLLLQPLVENAIKHGLEPRLEGGRIDVTARREGNVLVLTVRDTGVGLSPVAPTSDGSHFGMHQVRERLATLYDRSAGLLLAPAADSDGGSVATVRLPAIGSTGIRPPT